MSNKTVLLVDDEKKVLFLLSDALEEQGFKVKSTTYPSQALKIVQENTVDVVVLDLIMPGSDGIEILKTMKKMQPHIPVIMLSGHGTIGKAVEAVKLGAYDFLEKPVSSDKIAVTLKNALKQSGLVQDKTALLKEIGAESRIIGESRAIKHLFREIDKMAAADLPVLITGESGTGKELIARALHFKSSRAARPFVPVNCSAIPENLLESEIFGFEKGAFTDAHKDKPGLFEQADKGTLFLDEIAEMSLKLQPKLLRALERKEIRRVGGTSLKKVDVRIISASNKALELAFKEKTFREDLFYRVSVLTVKVPPLRERKEDIPVLIKHFTNEYCRERKRANIKFHPHSLELLMEHPWPGNVRQLKNLVEKIVVLSEAEEVLPEEVKKHLYPGNNTGEKNAPAREETLEQTRKKAEKEKLLTKLNALDWNYAKAAAELGISRATLFNKLKEHGISKKKR